jgi:cobalamin biosynthesis Mg chelatase CobN
MHSAPRLSALALSAATALASPFAAVAQEEVASDQQDQATEATPSQAPTPAPDPAPAPAADEERYAAREARDESAADFQGGDGTLVITGTAVGILVVIL